MGTGPPKVADAPKPTSSIRTITTFGAPLGAWTSKRGGGFTLRASSSVYAGLGGSAIGRTVRSIVWAQAARAQATASRGAGEEDRRAGGAEGLSSRAAPWRPGTTRTIVPQVAAGSRRGGGLHDLDVSARPWAHTRIRGGQLPRAPGA